MSKQLQEPLIPNNRSVSPPSSPGGSHHGSFAQEEKGRAQTSQLSRMIGGDGPSHTSMQIKPNKVPVVIHYWSQYNDGDHYMQEIEVFQNDRVFDVITRASEFFSAKYQAPRDPSAYLLRFADKKGKPKTDMPVLDSGQSVIETNFVRFSLCEKRFDEKSRDKMQPVVNLDDEASFTATETPSAKQPAVEEKRTIKKKICCCFTSSD